MGTDVMECKVVSRTDKQVVLDCFVEKYDCNGSSIPEGEPGHDKYRRRTIRKKLDWEYLRTWITTGTVVKHKNESNLEL